MDRDAINQTSSALRDTGDARTRGAVDLNPQTHRPTGTASSLACPNCGGAVPADAARCPYCGALNPQGAEAAYMGKLEDLREDTDRLDDNVRHGIASDLSRNAKSIGGVILAAFALIAFILGAAHCSSTSDERRELQSYQEREAFRDRHFQQLDQLYEQGDDAALVDYAWSLQDEPGYDALFSWKHKAYLEVCEDWKALADAEAVLEAESRNLDDYAWATTAALRLAELDASGKRSYEQLTPEERDRSVDLRAQGWRFLQDELDMSAAEAEAFAAAIEDPQGYIQVSNVKKALEAHFAQRTAVN